MEFYRISISTTPLGAEVVFGALVSHGVWQYEVVQPQVLSKQEVLPQSFDYGPDVSDEEGGTSVVIYVQEEACAAKLADSLRANLLSIDNFNGEFGTFDVSLASAASEVWEDACKEHFKPIMLGKVWIVPVWYADEFSEQGQHIVIEPGPAFGTGLHITTRVVAMLLQIYADGASVFDIGCGSGILSLVAGAVGSRRVVGCDIDQVGAANNSLHNLALNPWARNISFATLNILDRSERAGFVKERFDVVAANITADVICQIIGFLPELLNKGGVFIAGGIIDESEDEVAECARAAGLSCEFVDRQEGWTAFVFRLA